MEKAEQERRWANAKEKLTAAQLCYDRQLYGESITRGYYACYQAMWAAVGDPMLGLWRHGGLINEFCCGRWATLTLLPSSLAGLRKKLESLYRLRVAVDYAADSVSQAEAESGLNIVRELYKRSLTIKGGHCEGSDMTQAIHQPTAATAGLATAELILAIQKEFPQVRLVPCEPVEGEDIHLWAYLPVQSEERLTVQDRIVEIEHDVQEKYGVQTVVVAMTEPL